MKKLTLLLTLALGGFTLNANNYRMDEEKLDQAFARATEVNFDQMYGDLADLQAAGNLTLGAEAKTRGGYLIRAWFCGCIAMHRYYMGTTRSAMWLMYLCIPVINWVNVTVDFWWAVFDAEAYKKYENNDKYLVWMED